MSNTRRAMNAYASQGLETTVATASPHKLIQLLFDAAIQAVMLARVHLQQKEPAAKGEKLSKAIAIIDDGLKLSVDLEQGGELAQNLVDLYDYISLSLLEANITNSAEKMTEAINLLSELRGAWAQLGDTPEGQGSGSGLGPAVTTETSTGSGDAMRSAVSYGKL